MMKKVDRDRTVRQAISWIRSAGTPVGASVEQALALMEALSQIISDAPPPKEKKKRG